MKKRCSTIQAFIVPNLFVQFLNFTFEFRIFLKMQAMFEEYWNSERVQEGIATKSVIVGKLRINQRSYEDAFISDPV